MGILSRRAILGLGVILGVLCATAAAQVPGPVVNVVASDPFNQKQVEVDAAANPTNPSHILTGFIDYQTVADGVAGASVTSSAWCGYSFSTNSGKTWKNFLVPGFPGDTSAGGKSSPLFGSDKCGDPVVAWDTSGHAFFMGLAQNSTSGVNLLFVARFTDPDDSKGRLEYNFTRVVDSGNPSATGQDLDKPSLLYVPDPTSSNPAAGTLFGCGTIFNGTVGGKFRNKVVCVRSSNGGDTFTSASQGKVNGNVNTNNGTAIAPILDGGPYNGGVYVFWRAFLDSENGYWFVKLDKNGNATTPVQVVGGASAYPNFYPYDAPTLPNLARSNAFPTVATDAAGRILLAFQAYSDTTGFAMAESSSSNTPRVFLTVSTNGGGSWSVPRAVDYGPPNAFQFMPRIAVSGGGVFQILYYDARNDNNGVGRPLTPITVAGKLQYFPNGRDRRFDVRVIQGQFSSGNLSFPSPSIQVSRYSRSSTTGQILDRPSGCDPNCGPAGSCPAYLMPNLPIGAGGTVPFIGDYIALAPAVPLVRNAPGSPSAWRFATLSGDPQTFLAFFVSTQDVGFPLNSNLLPLPLRDINGDWTQFVPVGVNPPQPPKNPNSRDANVYFSLISPGLVASWSGTYRNLVCVGTACGGITNIPPQFNVTAENRSNQNGFFRLTIQDTASQDWSFLQTPPAPASIPADQNTVDTQILRNSSITLPVYYRFRSPGVITPPTAPVQVRVDQISGIGGTPTGGLQTTVAYSLEIDNLEVDNLEVDNLEIDNLEVDNTALNLEIDNLEVDNLEVDNASPSNLEVDNLEVDNLEIDNLEVDNKPDQQVTWTVTGTGSLPTPGNAITNLLNGLGLLNAGYSFQLLIYQTQTNPGVKGCRQVAVPTDVVISNIAVTNPNVANRQVSNLEVDNLEVDNAAISDPQASNATFVVNPGEQLHITLRTFIPTEGPNQPTPYSLFDELNPANSAGQVGQATFSTAANPDGSRAAAFFDHTPPVITANCFVPPSSTTAAACKTSGWYNSDVKVTWSVSDPQSGIGSYKLVVDGQIISTTGCPAITFNSDTNINGSTVTCTATNGAGISDPTLPPSETTASGYVPVKIDKTNPIATASALPAPNANGWNNTDVTVSFTGTDNLSGIANCSLPVTLSNEGAGQSASGICTDNAGNISDPVSMTINIDKTPPQITGSATAGGNPYTADTWTKLDVVVSFTCAEAGPVQSGIATNTVAGSTVNTETAGETVNSTGACADKAGNTAPAGTFGPVKIDKTPPQITGSATAGGNPYTADTWTKLDVVVSFTCAEAGPVQSGIATNTVAGSTVNTETAGETVNSTGACTDKAVNTAPAGSFGPVKIDRTPPIITITAPANNGTYVLNASVPSNYACSDSSSGVSMCNGPVNNGSNFSTGTLGPNTFTVTTTDNAGNSATPKSNAYVVIYNFVLTPPKSPARLGSAVPLVWQLKDANGLVISDMNSLRYLYSVFQNGTRTKLYDPATGATGKSDFRFNTTTNSFQFNWDTSTVTPSPGAGFYTIEFQLNDSSTRYSTKVQLK